MIVAGLGNPGSQYAGNRHNVGFLFLDHLAQRLGAGQFRHKSSFDAEIGETRLGPEKLILVKPQSYMNLSGGPVSRIATFYKTEPRDVLVVYDDVALPFGSIRVRPSGSAGGHKGMLSIIGQLGTEAFPRIRIGIAPEGDRKKSLAGFVLSNFLPGEREELPEIFAQCAQALELIVAQDVEKAMAKFNKRVASKPEDSPAESDKPR